MEMIAGNHDEAIMSLVNGTPYPEDLKGKFYEHHQWIEGHLDESYYDEINQLPRYIEMTVKGKKILFIHYEIENDKMSAPLMNNLLRLLQKMTNKLFLNYLKIKKPI